MDSILWRGIVFPGHEACRLITQGSNWQVEGTTVFSYEGQICHLNYQIVCNSTWQTVSGQVAGWLGKQGIDIQVKTDLQGIWWMNGVEQPQVSGCTDIDLNFSPSTNLLPIRRLKLEVGQAAEVKAAWLRFPSFALEPLTQEYRRLDETAYRYESAGGQFVSELKVNRSGFVVDYPGIWQAEVTSE